MNERIIRTPLSEIESTFNDIEKTRFYKINKENIYDCESLFDQLYYSLQEKVNNTEISKTNMTFYMSEILEIKFPYIKGYALFLLDLFKDTIDKQKPLQYLSDIIIQKINITNKDEFKKKIDDFLKIASPRGNSTIRMYYGIDTEMIRPLSEICCKVNLSGSPKLRYRIDMNRLKRSIDTLYKVNIISDNETAKVENSDINVCISELNIRSIIFTDISSSNVRIYNGLNRVCVNTIGDIIQYGPYYDSLMKIRCLGKSSVNLILNKVSELYETYSDEELFKKPTIEEVLRQCNRVYYHDNTVNLSYIENMVYNIKDKIGLTGKDIELLRRLYIYKKSIKYCTFLKDNKINLSGIEFEVIFNDEYKYIKLVSDGLSFVI